MIGTLNLHTSSPPLHLFHGGFPLFASLSSSSYNSFFLKTALLKAKGSEPPFLLLLKAILPPLSAPSPLPLIRIRYTHTHTHTHTLTLQISVQLGVMTKTSRRQFYQQQQHSIDKHTHTHTHTHTHLRGGHISIDQNWRRERNCCRCCRRRRQKWKHHLEQKLNIDRSITNTLLLKQQQQQQQLRQRALSSHVYECFFLFSAFTLSPLSFSPPPPSSSSFTFSFAYFSTIFLIIFSSSQQRRPRQQQQQPKQQQFSQAHCPNNTFSRTHTSHFTHA